MSPIPAMVTHKKGNAGGAGFTVAKFVEKPTPEVAREYLASQEYFWNSGKCSYLKQVAI